MSDPHEELLNEWKLRYPEPGFVRDGVISPEHWFRARWKLVFLLKEAYGDPKKPADWDLRDHLLLEWCRHPMWRTAAQWACVVQEMGTPTSSSYASVESRVEDCASALQAAAVVNIKKWRGKSRSEKTDLGEYVRRDGDLLTRQLDLLGPDLVICGATWSNVRRLWPKGTKVARWSTRTGNTVFVNFWHPAGWVRKEQHHDVLVSLLGEIASSLPRRA